MPPVFEVNHKLKLRIARVQEAASLAQLEVENPNQHHDPDQ
jgi:hypothetical protein